MGRSRVQTLGWVALGAVGCWTNEAPPPAEAPVARRAGPPDVVLITLDTTRADHLPTYGYFRNTAPNLDRFAKGAVVFDQYIVPMATTLPTHTSMLTGVAPNEHGVLANVDHGGNRFLPCDKLRSVPMWLQAQGYATGGFVSATPLENGTGIELGFDAFSDPGEPYERNATGTTDAALAWLSEQSADKPVFLWVHYYDPHNPYRAPAEFKEAFKAEPELRSWLDARGAAAEGSRPTGDVVRTVPTVNQYDAEIAYMDAQVQRVLDALAARPGGADAAVIIAGDHGEGLNQHGEPGHGLVWGEQLHAPLFIRAPGLTPRRVDGLVTAADLFPTLLGAVDLPEEAGWLSQVSGRDALTPEAPDVLSQTSDRQLKFGLARTYALTTPAWKLIRQGSSAQLFDRANDPYELTDVADAHADVVATLGAEIDRRVAAQQARFTAMQCGGTAPADDATLKALEELGYVEPKGGKP